jgi:hypothetical protein
MTKKLEDLFNLSSDDKDANQSNLEKAVVDVVTTDAYTNLEKIENALPQVRGLETSDIEMDDLANLAKDSYKDLMDLGMQVDSRFSAEIFGIASNMLGHAITAKTAKINKKLKMIELQLKKANLDQKTANKSEEIESTTLGEGKELDRNELLKILTAKKSEE